MRLHNQKTAFKILNFYSDIDNFTTLAVKIEFKISNFVENEDSFLRLKLENQRENLKEISGWLSERRKSLTGRISAELGAEYGQVFNRKLAATSMDQCKKYLLFCFDELSKGLAFELES